MPETETPTPLAGGIGAVTRLVGQQSFNREALKAQAQRRLRRQRQAERLHLLGPRPLFELLDEIARHNPEIADDIDGRLQRFARLDPDILHKVGGDRFAPMPLRAVGAGR